MNYEKELQFAEKLLQNFRLNINYVTKSSLMEENEHAYGLQDILNYQYSAGDTFQLLMDNCEPNTIYHFKNILMCIFKGQQKLPSFYKSNPK